MDVPWCFIPKVFMVQLHTTLMAKHKATCTVICQINLMNIINLKYLYLAISMRLIKDYSSKPLIYLTQSDTWVCSKVFDITHTRLFSLLFITGISYYLHWGGLKTSLNYLFNWFLLVCLEKQVLVKKDRETNFIF